MRDCGHDEDDPWADVRLTKEAIRARATLIQYTLFVSAPFVALIAISTHLYGFMPHEVTGVSCYNAMVTSIFFFDTLRNTAHACFDEARGQGLVRVQRGIPVVDPAYPHHRLASLSFAIGGRPSY
jgi:hypothetical protein